MKAKFPRSLLFIILTSITLQSHAMQIFIKMLTGTTLTIDIDPHATSQALYQACSDELEISVENIRLILLGKQIPNNDSDIASYGIQKESVMHLVIRKPQTTTTLDARSTAAGAGAPATLASTSHEKAEEASVDAVATAIITEALTDLETIDMSNALQVEAKLKQFGATYLGLIQLDFEEKALILTRILEYKRINALKAIHVLLRANHFQI